MNKTYFQPPTGTEPGTAPGFTATSPRLEWPSEAPPRVKARTRMALDAQLVVPKQQEWGTMAGEMILLCSARRASEL